MRQFPFGAGSDPLQIILCRVACSRTLCLETPGNMNLGHPIYLSSGIQTQSLKTIKLLASSYSPSVKCHRGISVFELVFCICAFYSVEICKTRERQPRGTGGEKMGKGNETVWKQHQRREEAEGCSINRMGIAD